MTHHGPAWQPPATTRPLPAAPPGSRPGSSGNDLTPARASWWASRLPGAADPAPLEITVAIAAVGLLAALTLVGPVGAHWPVVAGLMALVGLRARQRARSVSSGRRPHLTRWVFSGLAIGLVGVAAVRTSAPMTVLCLIAALGSGAFAAVGGRNWWSVSLAWPVLGGSVPRAVLWSWRGAAGLRRPGHLFAGGWALGLIWGGLATVIIGSLLASGDAAFRGLLAALIPDLSLSRVPAQVLVGVLVAGMTLVAAFTAVAPPNWQLLPSWRNPRPMAEWAVPVAMIDLLLILFLSVQVALLFEAYPESLVSGDLTPAERARQGFGQLVLVTLLVVALLSWAGSRCRQTSVRDARVLTGLGGTLLVLVLVVVASALRRLWLYQQEFGWTVLRVDVAAFELWLAVMIVACGIAWLLRRTVLVTRLIVGSAAAGLLVLGLAGPDALVASWNVDRFQQTGRIDLGYLVSLSDDAVPALTRLPAEQRAVVLGDRRIDDAPWFAANLSRWRAEAALADLRTSESSAPSGTLPRDS